MFRLICFFIFPLLLIGTPTVKTIAQGRDCAQLMQENLPLLSSLLEKNEWDTLDELLNHLETTCPNSEALLRTRILSHIIQKNPTQHLIQRYIDNQFDDIFIQKLFDGYESNYQRLYKRNQSTYSYVPIHDRLDSITRTKAQAVLSSPAYLLNDNERSLTLLFAGNYNNYLMRMHKEKPETIVEKKQKVDEGKHKTGMALHAGIHTPIYAVDPVFKYQQLYGISIISPLANTWVFDGFFKFKLNNNDRPFSYTVENQVEEVRPPANFAFGGSAGFKFFETRKFLLLAKAGIAYEWMNTGIERYKRSFFDSFFYYSSKNESYRIYTWDLSAGLSTFYSLGGRKFVGIQAQYHYLPYNNHKKMLTNIASSYASFELFFRF